ncbi:unnamed protein product [Nippostrongylus brasiliensis]|uniref:Neur_chan_LBD domain-containing protein n=1 Tax=Nippostrongylus brasiliensis TaxID=27835 RepID=A0A0N4Y033_NIPBR|nr:unnamed protein product [Nippostrongylus brasiliensis]
MYLNFVLVTWALSAVHFGDAGCERDPNLTVSYRRLHSDLFTNYNPMIPSVFAKPDPVADPDTYPDNVIIYSNGDILRVFTLSVLFTCTIRTGKFPFDMQKCSIDFDEYLMDPSETDLSLSIVNDAIFRGNGEWRIDNITNELKLIETSVEPYWAVSDYDLFAKIVTPTGLEPVSEVYTDGGASVVFHMHRLSSYYVTLMIIPIQLITNVSVFALFWIEAAGFIDQTVVTLSSLISLLVLTDIMDKSVPKTGEIPNSAKHIWWNILVMTLALCDVRLLAFLKKHDVNFRSKA